MSPLQEVGGVLVSSLQGGWKMFPFQMSSHTALTDQQLREKLDALEREEEREEEEKKEKEDFLAGNEEAEEVVMRCKEEEFLTEREGGEAGQRKEKRGNQVEKKTEMGSGGGDIVSPLKITIKHSIVIDADQEVSKNCSLC